MCSTTGAAWGITVDSPRLFSPLRVRIQIPNGPNFCFDACPEKLMEVMEQVDDNLCSASKYVSFFTPQGGTCL